MPVEPLWRPQSEALADVSTPVSRSTSPASSASASLILRPVVARRPSRFEQVIRTPLLRFHFAAFALRLHFDLATAFQHEFVLQPFDLFPRHLNRHSPDSGVPASAIVWSLCVHGNKVRPRRAPWAAETMALPVVARYRF
jgi:hypothetical protein